ncbi:MAG: tetratricopeptide repeat protein [Geobacter sp.]|nr:tetratricopeptide repeat protein [Geobacter sp.]
MQNSEAERSFHQGLAALEEGNGPAALACFEKAATTSRSPEILSYLGYSLACERGQIQKGIELCNKAIATDPTNPRHYLNLGKIHLAANDRATAIVVFREGLCFGPDERLVAELDALGARKPVTIKFLPRDHFLNKWLGIILDRLGLR